MHTEHAVARCHWRTDFDRQSNAIELQNLISQWSDAALAQTLQACFDRHCPAHEVWRVDTLQLDLGEIEWDDLLQELPRRVAASIGQALTEWREGQASSPSVRDTGRVLNSDEALRDAVVWSLQRGTPPWWGQGKRDAGELFDEWLAAPSEDAPDLLREIGQSERVRRRMVWQLGEPRVRRIVHLIEPWHGERVCACADQLFSVQARRQVPKANEREFRATTWVNILGWLLVDRGTLFNTTSFVRGLLWRTAQHYRIDSSELLQGLYLAVQAVRPLGQARPVFFSAIETLHRQTCTERDRTSPPSVTPATDHWSVWQTMLCTAQRQRRLDRTRVSYAELFCALARQDARRMAALVQAHGRTAAVRQGLVQYLDAGALTQVVRLVAPDDHPFILDHARHTQRLAQIKGWDASAIWHVLLAYLLLSHESRFNRRQLVRDTLTRLSRSLGYRLNVLLDLLLHTAALESAGQPRFELLAILRQWQGELLAQDDTGAWTGLLEYLRCGHGHAQDDARWRRGFAQLLADPGSEASRRALARILASPRLARVGDRVLSERLLVLAGAADWPQLLTLIDPAARDCTVLYRQMCDGARHGELPSLASLDLAVQLPAMLLQALPGLYGRQKGGGDAFDPARFWRRFTRLLQRQARVDITALGRQLQRCWPEAPRWTGRRTVPGFMDSEGPRLPSTAVQPLDEWLSRQDDPPGAMAWLADQPRLASDQQQWLAQQLPAGLTSPQRIIAQWTRLLAEAWQGAEARLSRLLTQVFWSVSLESRGLHLSTAQVLVRMTLCASQRLGIGLGRVLSCYRREASGMWQVADEHLAQPSRLAAPPAAALQGRFIQDPAGHYLHHPRLMDIGRHLLMHGGAPAWLEVQGPLDVSRLLHDVFHLHPEWLPGLLEGAYRQPAMLFRVHRHVPFAWLMAALRTLAPERRSLWAPLEALHRCLNGLTLPGTDRYQRTQALLSWVLEHGLARRWSALEPEPLVRGTVHPLVHTRAVDPVALGKALQPALAQLPPLLRHALSAVTPRPETPTRGAVAHAPAVRDRKPPTLDIPMRVPDAGLALIQSFLPMLFSRLGLTEGKQFVDSNAQRRAVNCLHYLATGRGDAQETDLMLDKVLCGLSPDDPVEVSIEISEAEANLCTSLLEATVQHWPTAGKSTPAGFRGNWLVRDGWLTEDAERWTLKVERRPYDVLISRSPYSFSIIKYPWMPKAISVIWPT